MSRDRAVAVLEAARQSLAADAPADLSSHKQGSYVLLRIEA